jgi:hypothetical protein
MTQGQGALERLRDRRSTVEIRGKSSTKKPSRREASGSNAQEVSTRRTKRASNDKTRSAGDPEPTGKYGRSTSRHEQELEDDDDEEDDGMGFFEED